MAGARSKKFAPPCGSEDELGDSAGAEAVVWVGITADGITGLFQAVILKSGSSYSCWIVFLESRPTDGAASGFCGWFDSVDFCRLGDFLFDGRLDTMRAHRLLHLVHQSPKPFIACIEDLTHFGAGSNGFGIGGPSLGEKGKVLEKGRSVAGELGGGFGIGLHARRLRGWSVSLRRNPLGSGREGSGVELVVHQRLDQYVAERRQVGII